MMPFQLANSAALSSLLTNLIQTGASANFYNSLLIPSLFVALTIAVIFGTIHWIKAYMSRNPVAQIDKEFRKEQDTLLALAEARKRERARLALDAEEQERIRAEIGELTIDLNDFLYKSCRHCLLALDDDTEVVVILDAEVAVHKACFEEYLGLNPGSMSKYLYLWPEDKFIQIENFGKSVTTVEL
jgi:hypothetical protein